VMLRRVDW